MTQYTCLCGTGEEPCPGANGQPLCAISKKPTPQRALPETGSTHAIERTSPMGEGCSFIGRCIKCGKEGLQISAINEACVNPTGMTDEDALLLAIAPKAQDT